MNASSLHKTYCAGSDVMPKTPQSQFHSSLKSNLSLEDKIQWYTPCFLCIILLCTRKRNLPLRFIFQNWTLKWNKKEEFKLEESCIESPEYILRLIVLNTHRAIRKWWGSSSWLSNPTIGCKNHLPFRRPCPVLSVNQACPLWSCWSRLQ